MAWLKQTTSRRAEIRKNRREKEPALGERMRDRGTRGSIMIALTFFVLATAILAFRDRVVPYRPGQYVAQDILSRVDFRFADHKLLEDARQQARNSVLRVYKANGDVWAAVESGLSDLPDQAAGSSMADLSPTLAEKFKVNGEAFKTQMDSAALTALAQYEPQPRRADYTKSIHEYVDALRRLIVLDEAERHAEMKRQTEMAPRQSPRIDVENVGPIEIGKTFSKGANLDMDLVGELKKAAARSFKQELQLKVVAFTLNTLEPTHVPDEAATAGKQNAAAAGIPESSGDVRYKANQPLKRKRDPISENDWQVLKAEHEAFMESLPVRTWLKSKMGTAAIVLLITIAICGYIQRFQGRVVRNHARGAAIAGLLLVTLWLAQMTGIGTGPLFIFGLAPTVLVAMILAIAYDRRFAMGIATVHAILVTVALDQPIGFFMVLFVGILTCCFLLDEVRTRSKLIEVGAITSVAMMAATLATGMASLHPIEPTMFILRNCLHAGAAGLGVGFFVMGILAPVEYIFRITTGMKLLELADVSHPLLRRLAMEAQGTYNHSLQVATLAEASAEAIRANSLLCRVGSYYHDIGKINKPDYFIENQSGGVNRHLNLTPNVSLLIIIGHVKDGVEMAKEYKLPTSLISFIQQHHGTTLVEYFYHQACQKKDSFSTDQKSVSEMQYRYPGPKPRSKESAIVMIADAVESATRALGEWSASRIETLVHDMVLKRLLDGQFDECDLTLRELSTVERTMIKCLLGIYHGRIAYPAGSGVQASPAGGMSVQSA